MDRFHGDEQYQILTATVQDVCETLGNPASWDADGHDALFWAKRLEAADFFANLGAADYVSILYAVMNSNSQWCLGIQRDIKHAIKTELVG
ncbi:hypothetical protein [Achromobacter xylosoxidans]|uniref:Uncharacterized protein n=1 Tax=Alcaligenes xylosoxydans xylosoxydans TaxID=85698 RepID=A0A424W5I6_ALCXX|nr:hypothetical protein [Achromobacter xylosoxidans]MBC9904793.1 hypothetical protein [Achromobacter xylosoxidans]MBD0868710.1 hypothetical protein [Achromobacter xylosoxidans]QNP87787.1 hypothetical protein IAG39_09875 [Achromobacter xylosoxidans]RPJ88438.1 hypothetical protein DY367_27920 [Achromobacter xylosoxidans]